MEQYVYRPAHELVQLIREGKAASADLVKEHVARIKERNGELNAVVALFEAEAVAAAVQRDRQAQEGKFLGPLHGVPITVKEQFWIQGKRSTINARMHKGFVAPEDAVVVDRIRKSGAVILGHTNVPRLLDDYQVWGNLYPEGKNPYNTDCTPCLREKPHGRWILGQPASTTAGQRECARLLFCSSKVSSKAKQRSADPVRSVFVFFDCPAGRKSGCHSHVAMMQSTDNRNRNQAACSGHRFRFGKGERWMAI